MSTRRLLGAGAVGILAILPFLPTLRGEFLNYDDTYLVQENQALLSWSLGEICSPWSDRRALGHEFLPLRDLSYRVDASLWGERGAAGQLTLPASASVGFRLSNLLWYGFSCALAAWFLLRLPLTQRSPYWLPLLAALLFAWHPAHAESVAWISGRKDLVSAVFAFLALVAYLRARTGRGGAGWFVLSGLAALAACWGKSTATALPLLALAVELSQRGRLRARLLRLLPLLLVCGAAALLAVWVGRRTGIAQAGRDPLLLLAADLPVLRRYLVTAFFPLQLRIDHGDLVQALAAPTRPVLLSLLALFPLGLLVWRRRGPCLTFATVWFLGGLLPVLNLIPFAHLIADRFLFLPLLGPCLLLAWGLGRLHSRHPRLAVAMALGVLLLWGGLALRRGLEFRTSESLWRAHLQRVPGDPLGLKQLGDAYLRRAQAAEGEEARRRAAQRAEAQLAASLPAFDRLPFPSPGHAFEAAVGLGDARRLLEAHSGALEAYSDALGRLSVDPGIPGERALRLRLGLLATAAEAKGEPAELEVAARALFLANWPDEARRVLERLDPARADALRRELFGS